MSIGVGQYLWLRMWNDTAEGDDAEIVDGILAPGGDLSFRFVEPQTVTHVAIKRISKDEAATLETERGVQQEIAAFPSEGAL